MFKSKHSGYIAGCRVLPMGGDKKQSTSTATSVADYSQVNTTTTNINDLSSRTSNSNNTTASFWTDNGQTNSNNTSANFTTVDSSTKITNTLDGGAISGIAGVAMDAGKNALEQVKQAFGLASTVVAGAGASEVHAYDYADNLFHGALDAVNDSQSRAYNAWDRASMMQENAAGAVASAYAGAAGAMQNAYADAKGTSQANQKLMLAVVAVAGVAVLAAARKG
jgi:hypothetical protein